MTGKNLLNPHSKVQLQNTPTEGDVYSVVSVSVGSPLLTERIVRAEDPGAFDAIDRFARNGTLPDDQESLELFRSLRLMIDPGQLSTRPRYGVPFKARGASASLKREVTLSGKLHVQNLGEAPPSEAARAWRVIAEDRPIYWHGDVVYGFSRPYVVQPELDSVFQDLARTGCASVIDDVAEALASERLIERESSPSCATVSPPGFAESKFTVLREMITPGHRAALTSYVEDLISQGWLRYGHLEIERFMKVDDPVTRSMLMQYTEAAAEIVGEPLQPAYSQIIAYRNEAELIEHRDYAPTHYVLSILIDYRPVEGEWSPWPFYYRAKRDDPQGVAKQQLGDGMLFCGHELLHSRPKLPLGHASTAILLGFARASYRHGGNDEPQAD